MTDDVSATSIKAFLIADVRGYTLFTQERGDEAAAKLAAKFAAVAREGVAARGGEVIELRGDEALAVFDSPRQAIRAAVDLQDRFVEETISDPALPLTVGIGLDAGEAVPVEGGYRGGALNLAARLCGQAGPGEVLATQEIVHLARRIDGITFADRGQVQLKNLAEPVTVIRVSSTEADAAERLRTVAPPRKPGPGGGPKPGRGRRRALIGVLAAAVLTAAIAIPLSLRGGGGEPEPSTGPSQRSVEASPNSVGRLDLGTGNVVGDTVLDSAPGEMAAGEGGIWVTEPDRGAVVRLDPKTGAKVDTVSVGFQPSGIAVGDGFVWVVNSGDPSVARISPGTNEVVPGDPVTEGIGNGAQEIAVHDGAAWVTNRIDGTVTRLASDTGELEAVVPLSDAPTGISADDTGVWVAGPGTGTVQRIDPATNAVTGSVHVGNGPGAVASDGFAVWVANTLDGTVSKVDPRTNAVQATVPVGEGPASIAFADDATWVTGEFSGTLTRIDGATDERTQIHLSSEPRGAVVDGGFLWFAARGSAGDHIGGTLEGIGEHGVDSIDPAVSYDTVAWSALILVYDGLVGFQRVGGAEGGSLVPDLAVGLPQPTDGGLTYRFQLRDGIRYSNGDPVLASDLGVNIRRGFEIPRTPVPFTFGTLKGASACRPGHPPCDLSAAIEADDDAGTIAFHLEQPDPAFLYKLALPFASAVPGDTPSKEATRNPIPGTGPYMIAGYRANHKLRLERNPHFAPWSAAAQPGGHADAIHWTFGPDPGEAVDAVEAGDADFTTDAPPSDRVQEVVTRFAGQTHAFVQNATHFWMMNTALPPFDDVRVRRAVSFATDRAKLAATYGELGARVTCQDLPPNFQGYEPYCPYTVDPGGGQWTAPDTDEARRLMREAGSPHTPVVVWSAKDLGDDLNAQAAYFVRLLDDLGLRATLQTVPSYGSLVPRIYASPSTIQFAFSGWVADYAAASNFLADQFTCGSIVKGIPARNLNTSQLCDPGVDAAVHRAEVAEQADPQQAGEAWAAADRAVVDLAPAVFVATPASLDMVSARVGNYQRNPQYGILLDQLWVR